MQTTTPGRTGAARGSRRARRIVTRSLGPSPSSPTAGSRASAARLIWGTLRGRSPDADERALLGDGLGGLVLFSRSLGDRPSVRALVAELRRISPPGLHVSVDQEGGHIVRLRDGFTAFPGAMAIGATRSTRLAFEVARASGRELAAVGIDTVLAPVLDLAADLRNPTLGSRAFGAEPHLVARLGAAAVEGYLAGGVLTVPKHFPGHGRTPLDSHVARPIVAGGMTQLRRDLRPFSAAVRAGAPMLMASHVRYDAMADDLPATLSPAVAALARAELGFNGVLLTDAMVMDAITADRLVPDACVAAIAAGSDVAMALHPARAAIEALAGAIDDGTVSPARVASALSRVLALAAEDPQLEAEPDDVDDEELDRNAALASEVARQSLTLTWDKGCLPVTAATSIALVDIRSTAASPVEDAPQGGSRSPLAAAMAARFPRLQVLDADPRDDGAIDAVAGAAARAEIVVVATRDAFMSGGARRLIGRLGESGRPEVRIALHSPADLALSPKPAAAIAAYSDVPASAAALADALLRGHPAFQGHLPVALPPEPWTPAAPTSAG